VSIALSLLLSELAAPPFDQLICTFSAKPQLHRVTGDTLAERVRDVAGMNWGMNTDIEAVFKLIYKKAVKASLAPADMVKTLFIFSVRPSTPTAPYPRCQCRRSRGAHPAAMACSSYCLVLRMNLTSGSRGRCAQQQTEGKVPVLLRRTWISTRPRGWTRMASAGRPRHRQASRRRRLVSRCCHPLHPRGL